MAEIDGRLHLGREARDARLVELDRKKVEQLVARMEAEMKAAAKELEFERAAALRDEIQQIRLRVLEQDQSVVVGRALEIAAKARPASQNERFAAVMDRAPVFEVSSVTVLPAGEEPDGDDGVEGLRQTGSPVSVTSTTTRRRLVDGGRTGRPGITR